MRRILSYGNGGSNMTDQMLTEALINWCARQQVILRDRLKSFEFGEMQIGRRWASGTWEDITAREIELIKRNIEELETLIAQYSIKR
jgi:hypothetical protein